MLQVGVILLQLTLYCSLFCISFVNLWVTLDVWRNSAIDESCPCDDRAAI